MDSQKEYWARSGNAEKGILRQPYSIHIRNVIEVTLDFWKVIKCDNSAVTEMLRLSAWLHDIGKLMPENQEVLSKMKKSSTLPINHVDAGVAQALKVGSVGAAVLIGAHHLNGSNHGLPDLILEKNSSIPFRDRDVCQITDNILDEMVNLHSELVPIAINQPQKLISNKQQMLFRFLLSCLVDADHSDAATHSCEEAVTSYSFQAKERHEHLDAYIENLGNSVTLEDDSIRTRNNLRTLLYQTMRDSCSPGIGACNAPVGTGKTTAVLAHLLRMANESNARRLFVVAPFTNIIDQTVDVLRVALTLPGEKPELAVAAHHHRLEFEDLRMRKYSFSWNAPIVVTTAVQFFETLASNRPSSLRKMHQLAHSVIFIDEAHAAIPVHLWPLASRWLKELESSWGCHIVLGSGSLVRFWEIEKIFEPNTQVYDLMSIELQNQLAHFEKSRITYHQRKDISTLDEVEKWISTLPGPRLCILNTVQSAAVVADYLRKMQGGEAVEHISTSLSPKSRTTVLSRIKKRLESPKDCDWTLVATSCVEAGVNLSFRTGIREACGICSFIQTGGRISRNGEYEDAELWYFKIRNDDILLHNPSLDPAISVMDQFWHEGIVDADHVTEALIREMNNAIQENPLIIELPRLEDCFQFPKIDEKFQVIEERSVTVIVNPDLAIRIKKGISVRPADIMQESVSIRFPYSTKTAKAAIVRQALIPVGKGSDKESLYAWDLEYDDFLGYMAGVLPQLIMCKAPLIV